MDKKKIRQRRKKGIRKKIVGNKIKPRISVKRSLKYIYTQIIDDQSQKTLVAASDLELLKKTKNKSSKGIKSTRKISVAYEVGQLLAKKAQKKKIKKVVFDRGEYKYHGRVKSLAQGAREGGLEF